jgi:RNA polymerase sigma-70 factor (ECF subfamily)
MDFSELYGRYARDVHRFALFLTGNRTLAEDLTAETFARALVAKGDLRVDTVKAYLLAIARNLYRDLRRREGRLVSLDEAPEGVDPAKDPDAASDGRVRLEEALKAVQLLPQGEREALVLAVDGEMSYERIAAVLGCSVPAVKVRVHRARARLKSILNKERT